jgi:hypothetical protein
MESIMHPLNQFTKQFKAGAIYPEGYDYGGRGIGKPKQVDERINDFIEEWGKENCGHLKIAHICPHDKQLIGGAESYLIVVFEHWPLTNEELNSFERRRDLVGPNRIKG